MAVTILEWLAISIFRIDAVCPTESATYKTLGWELKLDFECVEVGGEAVEEGLDFSFSFDAVLVGFEEEFDAGFDAGYDTGFGAGFDAGFDAGLAVFFSLG